jgi:arylsulfatase A-like enzyme
MKTVFILLDSLNRHHLSTYGGTGVHTPNIERLANKGIVFDNHYSGSLPCMPARREIMTGRLGFMESKWSPLQPFDEAYPTELKNQADVYSHLITDHYHYFESIGLGYNTPFDTWEAIRGQEGDPWHPRVKEPEVPQFRGKNRRQDWVNRSCMNSERDEEYPTPQCFERAVDFLEHNHKEDNWLLHLEVFDPHEPFICPKKYLDLYNDIWDHRYHFDWPSYGLVNPEAEGPDAIEHIRKCYAATLTMTDVWLGKLLDKMDSLELWKDTTVILTTDHGYLIGDYGYWAKNYMFDYRKLVNIPLVIYSPNSPLNSKRVKALTTTIDLMPTFLELHGAVPSKNVHGKSIVHLFQKDEKHHDVVLYGYFGKDISLTDGSFTYCRQSVPGSLAYHHTATPVIHSNDPKAYENADVGKFLSQTGMPVYRIAQPIKRHHNAPEYNPLYNIANDPEQVKPIHDTYLEKEYADKLKELMIKYQAPQNEYVRMGFDYTGGDLIE